MRMEANVHDAAPGVPRSLMPVKRPFPLEVRGLVKRFGTLAAVDDISFDVPRGVVFCLLGTNGAGKTTTLQIAQGVRRPTEGEVRVFGEDPRKASVKLKRRIGVLPQKFLGFDALTVRENVEYFAAVYDARPDVSAIIESLGLTSYADVPFRTLSGGTRRRAGIATALVNDPELLFLDEPTAGVDPSSRRQLWDVIRALKADGRAIVLTTHYMDEAERLADEVAILHKGRIVAQGPPDRVRLEHGGGAVLRVAGLQGELPREVATRPGIVHSPEGIVTIPLAAAAEGPAVIAQIVRAGVQCKEISVREPSLDDAFIRLVAEAP